MSFALTVNIIFYKIYVVLKFKIIIKLRKKKKRFQKWIKNNK